MLYKNISNSQVSGTIKDVDVKTGTVTGYFSVFGNVDSDGDIVMPGAFARSLKNNYHRLKHLNQHRSGEVLAGTRKEHLVLKEDNKGLYFESKISQTTLGKDIILLYEDGALDEHSIGYEVIKSRDSDSQFRQSRWNPGEKVPVKELLELKLWEGSTVTWGANEMATLDSIKSLTKEQSFDKMQSVLKALKHGKYEHEEIFEMLELTFEQLKQHIKDLEQHPILKMSDNPNIEFIDMMIPHHKDALKMVDDFGGKVTDAELKKIMAGIKKTQTAEIDTMTGIKKRLNSKQHILDLSTSSTQPAVSAPDPQTGVKSDKDARSKKRRLAVIELQKLLTA